VLAGLATAPRVIADQLRALVVAVAWVPGCGDHGQDRIEYRLQCGGHVERCSARSLRHAWRRQGPGFGYAGRHHWSWGMLMLLLAQILVVLVAVLHLYFLVLEMFLWTRPLGLKTFRNSPDKAETTRVLAANQGLYNGFLAVGLLYYLYLGQWQVVMFFLHCVLVAAVYGAYSVNKRIFFVQGIPAIAAIAVLWLGRM
jgi:putative membrane protein